MRFVGIIASSPMKSREMAEVQSAREVGMSSNYDSHSSLQLTANQRHISHLLEALHHLASPFTVADFGSATGLNSIKVFSAAFHSFRETCHSPIFVYHCDLPNNPWSVLFSNAQAYLSLPNIYVAGIGRSYYERLFPDNFISLAHAANTLHWLSSRSTVPGQLLKYIEGDAALHAELQAIAEADLTRFLSHRSEELKAGGRMILQVLTCPFKQECRYHILLRMQQEGLISPDPLLRASIYMYPVSVGFITATIAKFPCLRMLYLHEFESVDQFYQQYETDGDRDKFARERTAMGRAVSEGLVKDLLKEERSEEKDLVGVYFAYMEDYWRHHAEPIPIKEVDAVIEKRS